MKIIHTADWHLGQNFYEHDRLEEQSLFLDFLLDQIKHLSIDVLIIAGDIFDTANPPRAAEQLYYQFLFQLSQLKHCQAVVIGGNHDSAPHLDAPRSVLSQLNVHVIGSLPDNPDDAILHFQHQGKRLSIAAIPFLRDRDVRRAIEGELIDDMEARTKAGIVQNYRLFAQHCLDQKQPNEILLATGHLTAVGASLSDSERSIHIGNLGSIRADQFPAAFDYVALGHLHKPQSVGNNPHIRYAGSPLPLSFSESPNKELRLLSIQDDGSLAQSSIPIPLARRLIRLEGSADAVLATLQQLDVSVGELTPWIEVTLSESDISPSINDQIREAASQNNALVLKVGRLSRSIHPGNLPSDSIKNISEWAPQAVFDKRIEDYQGDIPPNTLKQCFLEVLHAVQESDAQ